MIVLVIASAEGDGTTMMASNLAKALAEDGYRTALVDAELYPAQRNQPSGALASWKNEGPATASCYVWLSLAALLDTGQSLNADHLAVPTEILLKAVFAGLRGKFDFIILDSPPLPGVADGMTLGGFSNLILSVITLSKTLRRAFAAHAQSISVLDRMHGLIINQAEAATPYKSRGKTILETILRRT